MLLIDGEDDVYFLDRNNDVFKVEGMNFPLDPASTQSLRDTLLDGEMIIDKVSQGVVRPRFLVYDMVHYMVMKCLPMMGYQCGMCYEPDL